MGQRILMHFLLLLLAFSFVMPPLHADDVLLDEPQELPFKYFFGNEPLVKGAELQLSGQNHSEDQRLLIFRLDNAHSSNYRSRVNQEYSLPKGAFNLSLPLTGLKTSGGDILNQPYSEMTIFAGDDSDSLSLDEVRISTPEALPENTLALDFGHERTRFSLALQYAKPTTGGWRLSLALGSGWLYPVAWSYAYGRSF